jgi:hypothetical protein
MHSVKITSAQVCGEGATDGNGFRFLVHDGAYHGIDEDVLGGY